MIEYERYVNLLLLHVTEKYKLYNFCKYMQIFAYVGFQ